MNEIWNGTFTLETYTGILHTLQRLFPLNYTIGDIPQILSQIFRPKFVIRHDVLGSMDTALEMAKLEKELGIRATYMIAANTPKIPLAKPRTWETLEQLKRYNHEVGIFIDTGKTHPPKAELERLLRAKRARFEKNLSFPVLSVVFPSPPPKIDPSSFFIGGMIHAGAASLTQWSLTDLQRPWQQADITPDEDNPERCLLQILIHPHLWNIT